MFCSAVLVLLMAGLLVAADLSVGGGKGEKGLNLEYTLLFSFKRVWGISHLVKSHFNDSTLLDLHCPHTDNIVIQYNSMVRDPSV